MSKQLIVKQNTAALAVYDELKDTIETLATGLDRQLTMGYIFQHTFVKRLQTPTFKAELQMRETWAQMTADDVVNALNEVGMLKDLSNLMTVKQHVIFALITRKSKLTAKASPDFTAIAKALNSILHYDKMIKAEKTSRVKSGTTMGKGI